MFDLLIAGSGMAGSSLAIQLGRQGFRVGLYERSCFLREKWCGEGLMPARVTVLERIELGRLAFRLLPTQPRLFARLLAVSAGARALFSRLQSPMVNRSHRLLPANLAASVGARATGRTL